ncbi:MAG TPA: DnaA/Hda family protein [Gemmatimonadales bacterium]
MTTGPDPSLTFAGLVAGTANQLALAAARAVAESPTPPFNPLYLHGDAGTGKTHLLHAIGNMTLGVNGRAVVCHVRWGDLVAGVRTAAALGRQEEYLAPVESAGLLLVDEMQPVGDRDAEAAPLLALLDRRLTRRLTTVLAGRQAPAALGGAADLAARLLGAGLVAELQPPDSAMRWEILHRQCEAMQVPLSEAVLEAVALLPFDNIRDLIGAANRLIAFQSVSPRPLDPAQARVLITGVLDEPVPDAGVPTPRESRQLPPEPRLADDGDEFGSFLSEVVASVSQQVDEWRARVGEAMLRWGGEGYRTARLQALLDTELPAQPDAVLRRFEADAESLARLRAEIADVAPDLAGQEVLWDPDQLGAAEELLEQARTRGLLDSQPLGHYTFEGLVEGTSNRLALDAVRALASGSADSPPPLLLVGESGAGKTHLLHAMGNLFVEQGQRGVACLGAYAFAGQVREAGEAGALPAWRRRFRWASALLIDDVHLLATDPAAQEELAALMDQLAAAGRPMAFTTAVPVAELTGVSPQLLTRMAGGLIVELPPPDREVRLGVVRQLLGAIEVPDAPALEEYLAGRPADSIRAVHAAVQRVLRAAEAGHTEPTQALARQVLEAGVARPAHRAPARRPAPSLGRGRLGEKLVEDWPVAADRLIEELR